MIYGAIIEDSLCLTDVIQFCCIDCHTYNWLLTELECYGSSLEGISRIFLNGEQMQALCQERPYLIWGVCSALPLSVTAEQIQQFPEPHADNPDFWKDTVNLQTPLTELEIIFFDSSETFILSKQQTHRDRFLKAFRGSVDMILYNQLSNRQIAVIRSALQNRITDAELLSHRAIQFYWLFFRTITVRTEIPDWAKAEYDAVYKALSAEHLLF